MVKRVLGDENGVITVFQLQWIRKDPKLSTTVTRDPQNICLQAKILHHFHARLRYGNTISTSDGQHTNVSGISIGTSTLVLCQGKTFLHLDTHSKVIGDYYSLLLNQPPNRRPLHQLRICSYETPWHFWAPNMAKTRVNILPQLPETFMVHQQQQRRRMWYQGNNIYLKLPLIWVIVSISIIWKELILQSSTNTYFVGFSPLYIAIIRD